MRGILANWDLSCQYRNEASYLGGKALFARYRKKSQVEELIKKDGFEHVTDHFAEIVSSKLTSREIAYQFLLEEIEGASMGNSASKEYAVDLHFQLTHFRHLLHRIFDPSPVIGHAVLC